MEVVGYKDTDWSGYYGACMDGDCVYLAGPIHKQVRIISLPLNIHLYSARNMLWCKSLFQPLDDLIWVLFSVLHFKNYQSVFQPFTDLNWVLYPVVCHSALMFPAFWMICTWFCFLCYSVLKPVLVSVVLDGNSGPPIRPIMSVIADLPCGCRPQFTPPSSRSKSSESKGSILFW